MSYKNKWFHANGLIKLNPDETEIQENSILFTITHALANKKRIHKLVIDHVDHEGQIIGTRSWDNMTAIITYLAKTNGDTYKSIKILPKYLHPRDIIYIGYVQRRWWVYPLLPLLYLIFLWTALTEYKVRPTLWDWIFQGFPKRTKILKTDAEILYWIRLFLPKKYSFIHWTAKTIVPLLQKRFGKDYVNGMMSLYYRHPEHPNRKIKVTVP